MKLSLFAGLEILEAGDPLSLNNGTFTGSDREVIDRLLRIGAKTHRHTGLSGLTTPAVAPSASVVPSGGTIGAGLGITIGYTEEDNDGGQTELSPVAVVSTPPPLGAPQFTPSAALDTTAGELLVNTYFYAMTFTDGEGGETPLGPAVNAVRPPGFEHGRIVLSHLTHEMAAIGAVGWRLYRAVGGETFNLLATGNASEDEFIDDGTHSLNCDVHPPAGEQNTTNGINTLRVVLPAEVKGSFVNVYATVTGDFSGGSLIGSYPTASAGATATFSALSPIGASPPSINLSIGGAHQIDPDTELLDWHWKRPVATAGALPSEGAGAEEGDARIVLSTGIIHIFHGGDWVESGSSGSASGGIVVASGATELAGTTEVEFEADAPVDLALTDEGGGRAKIAIGLPHAMGVVTCGEDLTKPRPEGYEVITWITEAKGETEPENMVEGDILIALP